MACFPLKRGIIANLGQGPVNQLKDKTMVIIFDGNSEIGARVRSNLYFLICVKHLIRSREVKKKILFFSFVRNVF